MATNGGAMLGGLPCRFHGAGGTARSSASIGPDFEDSSDREAHVLGGQNLVPKLVPDSSELS